ncbi:flagellar basal body rod protein FlgB [Variovorax terrae]|uniref:Flagellar basal body rod protein FlgB n=1 Tax=Variovorax terrae TaxID=2923278 RepID=A0A9X1VVI6_9BURK|nr:flagellar basal body protein [Variovorax terrae]MCJ0764546.1 flagellar basal body protein [Variovorax terrae]
MTEGMEAITVSSLALALDAASLRHQAIAVNIANANTPGHVPLRVNFEAQLEEARRSLGASGRLDANSLAQVRPTIEPAFGAIGQLQGVQLDVEITAMAQNAMQYQALAKGLSRHYAILSMAVSDGKK